MKLESFGAILTFAAELEALDGAFYEAAAEHPACAGERELFLSFARESAKNEKTALRIRRENVTEMILEAVKEFTSEAFAGEREGVEALGRAAVIARARDLEEKALAFYEEASQRIKALPEAARALRSLAKKRQARLRKLDGVAV